jgi:anti-sigma factor RsiW
MSMHPLDRTVGGMTCREVLGDLSGFLDGELPGARLAQVRAHLAGCAECERFGGQVAALVARARRELAVPAPIDAAVSERLHARLRAVRDGG